VLNREGSFAYNPAPNFNGVDSFTYTANDGTANSNVATVTITVNAVNDAPVASNNTYTKNEDVTLTVAAPGVLGNDSDVDGEPLTAVLVSGPAHGVLTLNVNGSFTFVPAANYNGLDSFTYRANDGKVSSNVATVSLVINSVNDAPVAGADNYSTAEDTPLTIAAPGVLANDSDVESTTLTAIMAANPGHGTVTLNANGSFVYTPDANFNGVDFFAYRANDGAANSTAVRVTITVGAVNDAPVANNQSRSMSEDGTKAITLTASDAEGSPLTYAIVTPPAHGTLTGVAPNVSYKPAANYNGPDSFTFRANDGLLNSNIATVSITVNAVNDAPVAQAASFSVTRNTMFVGRVVATDVEGSALTYFITTQPTKGTVVLNSSTGGFIYIPAAGKTGADSFKFKANDGVANSNAARIDITIK
jgi:large repetitive protein